MTVQSATSRYDYNCNGATTSFPVGFYFLADSHILVQLTNTLVTPQTTVDLVLNSDYTVTGAANPSGGSITTTSAYGTGYKITILRNVPLTQLTDYVENSPFPAASHEAALDLLTMQNQMQDEKLDRAFLAPSGFANIDTELPAPAADYLLAWDSAGTALTNVTPASVATVVAYGTSGYDSFTGTGAQTAFTLSADPGALYNLRVSVNGAVQKPNVDYTWAGGTTLTFAVAPSNGAAIAVFYQTALTQGYSDSASVSYTPGYAGSSTRTVLAKLQERVSILDFGGIGNDSTDNTPALNAAASYCALNGKAEIYFPPGAYRFLSKPDDFLSGVKLVGDDTATTYFKRHYTPGSATEGFLTWNPSGAYQAGGGIWNIGLLASANANGGALIKLVATATTRPGFMNFVGIKTGSNVSETVNYVVYIDGSAFTTLGSNGVRDINFTNCWFFNASTHSVYVNNGVHVYFTACLVNAGAGSVADFFITGGGGAGTTNSALVLFSGCECGNLTLDNTNGVSFQGNGGALSVASTVTDGSFVGAFSSVSNSSTTTHVLSRTSISCGSGVATSLGGTLTVTGDGTFSGTSNQFGGNAVASPQVLINGTGATQKSLFWKTGGSSRWQWYVSTAEGGADSGSNIALACYTDAAAFIDNPIQINRVSAGTMTFGGSTNRPAVFNGYVQVDGATGRGLRYANATANGSVATTLGSLGPTGAATTVQGWIRISIAGTDRYIPFW